MNLPKKVIRRVRRVFNKPKTLLELAVERRAAEESKAKVWENDKKLVRTRNFKKAQEARNKMLAEMKQKREAEEKRQNEIYKKRLKNLKKARKAKSG